MSSEMLDKNCKKEIEIPKEYKYLVSVIIPHYNTPNTLEILLNSIPNDNSIQVIVIDDCSDKHQKAYELLSIKYNSERIIFTKTSNNFGAGHARNIGISRSLGKWIIFADADDFFLQDAFNNIFSMINDSSDIIYFPPVSRIIHSEVIANRHIPYTKLFYNLKNNYTEANILRLKYKWNSPWSKMIRKSLLDQNKIHFQDVRVANDVMFSTYCSYWANSISICDKQIYCISCSNNSLTRQKNIDLINTRLDVLIEKYKFLENHLKCDDLKIIDISGRTYLKYLFDRKYDIQTILFALKKMKDNGLPILNIRFL